MKYSYFETQTGRNKSRTNISGKEPARDLSNETVVTKIRI